LQPQSSKAPCSSTLDTPANIVGLMVQPDDGLQPLLREIDAAICSIDLSVYILSDPTIIEALGRAQRRGVTVRVMLEEHPYGGGGAQEETRYQLEALGIDVQWSGSQTRFSHAKYMVIDTVVVVIMNQNLTTAAFATNRDFAVVTTSPAEVLQASSVFERDWNHEEINDPPGPLILSPSNSRTRFIEIIDGATISIDFYAEIVRNTDIVAALQRAVDRGVAVRLVVDNSIDEEMRRLLAGLVEQGVEVRISSSLYIHAKLMLVDRVLAIVGSQNPTSTSLDRNREVSMVVTDSIALDRAGTIFARDWLLGTPFGVVNHPAGSSGTNAFQVYRLHSNREPSVIASAHPASTAC
jgi:phosphatidylserine/phosphatidylglycerophosphate/cardiolipin synthase-like enzyme